MTEKIKYKGGYKYQLQEDYEIQLDRYPNGSENCDEYLYFSGSGLLTMKKGYCWDGPSGPTIDTSDFMRGSLIHDALYQLIRRGHLFEGYWRKYADDILMKTCREDGMGRLRAYLVFVCVRVFGECSFQKPRQVLTAP